MERKEITSQLNQLAQELGILGSQLIEKPVLDVSRKMTSKNETDIQNHFLTFKNRIATWNRIYTDFQRTALINKRSTLARKNFEKKMTLSKKVHYDIASVNPDSLDGGSLKQLETLQYQAQKMIQTGLLIIYDFREFLTGQTMEYRLAYSQGARVFSVTLSLEELIPSLKHFTTVFKSNQNTTKINFSTIYNSNKMKEFLNGVGSNIQVSEENVFEGVLDFFTDTSKELSYNIKSRGKEIPLVKYRNNMFYVPPEKASFKFLSYIDKEGKTQRGIKNARVSHGHLFELAVFLQNEGHTYASVQDYLKEQFNLKGKAELWDKLKTIRNSKAFYKGGDSDANEGQRQVQLKAALEESYAKLADLGSISNELEKLEKILNAEKGEKTTEQVLNKLEQNFGMYKRELQTPMKDNIKKALSKLELSKWLSNG